MAASGLDVVLVLVEEVMLVEEVVLVAVGVFEVTLGGRTRVPETGRVRLAGASFAAAAAAAAAAVEVLRVTGRREGRRLGDMLRRAVVALAVGVAGAMDLSDRSVAVPGVGFRRDRVRVSGGLDDMASRQGDGAQMEPRWRGNGSLLSRGGGGGV